METVIEKEADAYKKAMLKAQVLSLKLLHNQRSNMVQIMKKIGATPIEPKDRKTDAEKKSE
jgi:hypothetical protein